MPLQRSGMILNRCLCTVHYFSGLNVNYCYKFSRRTFSLSKILYKEQSLTIELLPEITNLLETEEMKHRQHPGLRKIDPIRIPDILQSSVEKIISEKSESFLINEARKLWHHLSFRRLPVEQHEIEEKILSVAPDYDGDFRNLSKTINKRQLQDLKKRINLELGRWKPIEYDHHACLSYLVGRLAPNYASVSHLFDELQKKVPDFKPRNYFDFGSGVGSALWAAHAHWSDSIKEYYCVDVSSAMIDLCTSLISDEVTEQKHIDPVFFRQFLPASDSVQYDLVVSAFSLLELHNAAERLKVIDTLWRKTKQFLVLVEYGTVAGFHCILDARDFILQVENSSNPEYAVYSSGAHVISPCPHDLSCPKFMEKNNSTCGFKVPYYKQFPRRHSLVIEKDWISYVIIRKGSRSKDCETLPRIVKPVLKRPKITICSVCCSDGKLKQIALTRNKHGRHAYRCARVAEQGDILPIKINHNKMSFEYE